MTGLVFAVLFGFIFLLFSCKGQISLPPGGDTFIILPGENVTVAWKIDVNISDVSIRQWTFLPKGNIFADILRDLGVDRFPQHSPGPFTIKKPSTLILKNVNIQYNGTYTFKISAGGTVTSSDVTVFVAVKPNVTIICSSPFIVGEGDNVTCVCRGKGGNPPANVTWLKDGVQIGKTGKEEQKITFHNVSQTENGTYKCVARSHMNSMFVDEKTNEIIVRRKYKPKNTTITFTPEKATFGRTVNISCDSDGFPEPSYTITHNGTEISNEMKHTILVVKWDDAGTYICIARNELGNNSDSGNLTVKGQISLPPVDDTFIVLPGENVTITWRIDVSISQVKFRTWEFVPKGNTFADIVLDLHVKKSPQNSPGPFTIKKPSTLILRNVNIQYNGTYSFSITDSNGITNRSDVTVFVAVKPNVTFSCSSPIIVGEGDNFTCVCRGKGGNPTANVTWFKDGVQIGETEKEEQKLTLSNVSGTENGTYKCVAQSHTNSMFVDEKSTEIIVRRKYKPKNTIITFTPEKAIFGRTVDVTCKSDSFHEPSYTITHNGTEVSNEMKHTILEVKWDDAGTYICIAKNELGNDSNSGNLTVKVNIAANKEDDGTTVVVWHIMVSLVSGIIIGILLSYIVWCSHRRWFSPRRLERNPEPKTTEVDTTYQELDLTKMNAEDNYQSLRVNAASNDAASNDDDSTYTELNKTRDVENNYQSLT